MNNFNNLCDILNENCTSLSHEFAHTFKLINFGSTIKYCLFYQGCGEDISISVINGINHYIFSDIDIYSFEMIKSKLNKLLKYNFISNLIHNDSGSHFYYNNGKQKIKKKFSYTNSQIHEINFKKKYNTNLGLIYIKNSGSSTYTNSFWTSVDESLIPSGYILGTPESNSPAWSSISNGKLIFDNDFSISDEYRSDFIMNSDSLSNNVEIDLNLLNLEYIGSICNKSIDCLQKKSIVKTINSNLDDFIR